MSLGDIVEKLFADNPDLSEDEAVKTLKEMKDPQTNKSMWKAATIRNRVNTHLKKKEGRFHDTRPVKSDSNGNAAHIESPVETKGSGSDLEIEGKEIERHRPKDPFAIKPEENVEEKVDQIKEGVKTAVYDEQRFKKGIVDDVSRKVIEQVSAETKSFREETISIIGDLKSSMVDVITGMKEEMVNIQKQGLPAYEPIVTYNDLELKQSTIDAIRKNTEEKELEEESTYIDNLIENEKEYTSVLKIYHKLIDLARGAEKGVQLRLFYDNNKLYYDKEHVGRFGINLKTLIGGVAIGIPIGIAIWLIYTSLTSVPPPILPPVP